MIPLLLLLLLQPAPPASPPSSGDAEALVSKLEQRRRDVHDVVAQFTQTYRSGALGKDIVERGELRLKQPGRMRWDYAAPDKKVFVADGTTFYFYVPADRQVVVRQQDDQHSVAGLLLAGGRSLRDEFSATTEAGAAPLATRIRLTPRRPGTEVSHVLVDLDAAMRVLSIQVVDPQGNASRFDFSGIRENTGLADRLFRFETPKGVEVIEG